MRVAVGLLAALSAVGLASAFAAENPPPSADSQSQQAAAPAQSAPATSTATAPTTAPATANAPAAPTSAAPTVTQTPAPKVTVTGSKDLTPQEKNLISSGYVLETRKDQKLFCKKETTLGSRFPHTTCQTSDQIFAQMQRSKDATSDIQRGFAIPPAGGPGKAQ